MSKKAENTPAKTPKASDLLQDDYPAEIREEFYAETGANKNDPGGFAHHVLRQIHEQAEVVFLKSEKTGGKFFVSINGGTGQAEYDKGSHPFVYAAAIALIRDKRRNS
jgi:hypothetical protein